MTRGKVIKRVFFKQGGPLQVEVIDLASLSSNHRQIITQPHRADFYHVFWFQECSPIHVVDFMKIKTVPNSLLFVNKESVHTFDDTPYKGKVVIFTDNFFCVTDRDRQFLHNSLLFNGLYPTAAIPVKRDDDFVTDAMRRMEAELKLTNDGAQSDILHNLLHNLLLSSERLWQKQKVERASKGIDFDYTVLFKDLLEVHFRTDKLVNAYASKMAVSEKRLNKATTQVLGKTPKEIIEERVILESKRLLTYTNLSVKEIAVAMGFDEPTYFIRFFRKQTGGTPLEFRVRQ